MRRLLFNFVFFYTYIIFCSYCIITICHKNSLIIIVKRNDKALSSHIYQRLSFYKFKWRQVRMKLNMKYFDAEIVLEQNWNTFRPCLRESSDRVGVNQFKNRSNYLLTKLTNYSAVLMLVFSNQLLVEY